jgi:hypothetical protein
VGQKSGRAQALDPRPPHSQSFFLPERNFRPVGGHADNRFEKSSNEINVLMNSGAADPSNFSPFIPFLSQPDLPGLPTPSRSCLRCGKPVPAPKRSGRPSRFCSDQCRRQQAAEQRAAWVSAHSSGGSSAVLVCWACGDTFPAPATRRGRLPRFCSADCKRCARRDLNAGYRLQRRRWKGRDDA